MSNPNFIDAMSTNEIYRDLDHSRCLTDDLDTIEANIKGLESEKAPSNHTHTAENVGASPVGHNHNGDYAPSTHAHTEYADKNHNHTGTYSPANHNHDGSYAAAEHNHADKADLVNGVIPISQIPKEVKEVRIVGTIADRNALTGLFAGLNVYVTNATGDSTVKSGGAYYLYDGKGWIKTAEAESLDLVLQWTNIQGKPTSMKASGGNADTVGGKQPSDFAMAGHKHTASEVGASPANHEHNYASLNHTHTASSVGAIATAMLTMLGITENGDVQLGVHSGSAENVLDKLKTLGAGMHTAYSAKGISGNPNPLSAFRFLCHFTSATEAGATNGWCIAFSTAGGVYECVISGGVWQPWHAIYERNPGPLWSGGYFMAENQTITPSKKLSECQHGWLLLWSDYDASTRKANDVDYCTTMIPKRKGDNNLWSGQKYLCRVEAFASEASPYTAEKSYIKPLKIYDDKIVGNAINNQAGREDVVLRAIYEF